MPLKRKYFVNSTTTRTGRYDSLRLKVFQIIKISSWLYFHTGNRVLCVSAKFLPKSKLHELIKYLMLMNLLTFHKNF